MKGKEKKKGKSHLVLRAQNGRAKRDKKLASQMQKKKKKRKPQTETLREKLFLQESKSY